MGKKYPNSKLLNIKLSKHYFKIEQAVLSLDDEFSIEKLKAMLSGKSQIEAPETFQVFADKIIQQMMVQIGRPLQQVMRDTYKVVKASL